MNPVARLIIQMEFGKSLPITALCRCNQVRLLIKIQEVLERDTTFN